MLRGARGRQRTHLEDVASGHQAQHRRRRHLAAQDAVGVTGCRRHAAEDLAAEELGDEPAPGLGLVL
jgi:hypothetical protein